MATFDSFVFAGHGKSEVDGSYDSGAVNGSVKENDLTIAIQKSTKKYLDSTSLKIHYDEQNFKDNDLKGNTYKYKSGITIHINSTEGASGVESWVPLTQTNFTNEKYLNDSISKKLGIPNRGIKSRDYYDGKTYTRKEKDMLTGLDYYKEIREARKDLINLTIVEVGFIEKDLKAIQANIDQIGFIIANYICMLCNTVYKPSTPTTKTTYYRVIAESNTVRGNSEATVKALKGMGYDAFIEVYEK